MRSSVNRRARAAARCRRNRQPRLTAGDRPRTAAHRGKRHLARARTCCRCRRSRAKADRAVALIHLDSLARDSYRAASRPSRGVGIDRQHHRPIPDPRSAGRDSQPTETLGGRPVAARRGSHVDGVCSTGGNRRNRCPTQRVGTDCVLSHRERAATARNRRAPRRTGAVGCH